MAAYLVVRIREIIDEDGYAEYREMVLLTLERYGGRFLARGGRAEVLEGEGAPGRVVILEFPTYEQASSWYWSDEYAPAKSLRLRSARAEAVLVEGL